MPFDARRLYPGRIHWRRWCRNGMPVQTVHAQVANGVNHCAAFRRKMVFAKALDITNLSAGVSGSREKWRFAFRSGYNARYVMVVIGQARPDNTGGSDARVDLQYGTLGGSLTTSLAARFPDASSSPSDVPSEFAYSRIYFSVSDNTEYEVVVRAHAYARPFCCVAYEIGDERDLDPADNGLVDQNHGVGSPILDEHHEELALESWRLWERNAAHLMAWSVDDQTGYYDHSGTTPTNVIDRSSTGNPSTVTPGFRYILNNSNRQGNANVNVKFAVYASGSTGIQNNNTVLILDTSGTVLASIQNINAASPKWWTTTAAVTAATTKYDIQVRSNTGGTSVQVYAAALWVED